MDHRCHQRAVPKFIHEISEEERKRGRSDETVPKKAVGVKVRPKGTCVFMFRFRITPLLGFVPEWGSEIEREKIEQMRKRELL